VSTIYSDHIVVTPGGIGKVIDRSLNGRTLYVTYAKVFGPLTKVPASEARLATAEEVTASIYADVFHLAAPDEDG
jgi:hypothetical protein